MMLIDYGDKDEFEITSNFKLPEIIYSITNEKNEWVNESEQQDFSLVEKNKI